MKHLPLALLAATVTLLGATSCGPDDPVADNPRHIELPVVAECGSIPEGPWVLTVQITKDGDIYVPDRAGPQSLIELLDYLRAKREEFGPEAVDWLGNSKMDVLLEADALAPWPPVALVFWITSEPSVSTFRTHFVVRRRGDAGRGTFSYSVPYHRSLDLDAPIPQMVQVTIDLGSAEEATNLDDLAAAIRKMSPEILAEAVFRVHPSGSPFTPLPVGSYLGVLDAIRRGGAKTICELPFAVSYHRPKDLWQDPGQWALDHPARTRPLKIVLDRSDVPKGQRESDPHSPSPHGAGWGYGEGRVVIDGEGYCRAPRPLDSDPAR